VLEIGFSFHVVFVFLLCPWRGLIESAADKSGDRCSVISGRSSVVSDRVIREQWLE
jgi:hypothetical protein